MIWNDIRQTYKDETNLGTVPVPLPNREQAHLGGVTVAAFEYSLRVPWSDIDLRKEWSAVAIWHFKCGATVMLFHPSTTNYQVQLIRGSKKSDSKEIARIFGTRELSSDYDFFSAELNATPSQVHWWSTRATKARSLVLLNLKSIEIMRAKAIYQQSSEEMRGFQIGDPSLPPYRVEMDLFDRNDRRYKIWIVNKSKDHTLITQPELNALVESLKPIPHS